MMKSSRSLVIVWMIILFATITAGVSFGKALLPSQYKRRGLTNEQIDYIMTKRPNEQLLMTAQDWRAMRFELCRYHNVTNWADELNDKAGFSAHLLNVEERMKDALSHTNELHKTISKHKGEIAILYAVQENITKKMEKLAKKALKSIEKLGEKMKKAKTDEEKAAYQAAIDLLRGDS